MRWLVGRASLGSPPGWLLHVTGHLPGREAHLDAGWTLFSGGWCFLLLAAFYVGDRREGLPALGVPAGRHRHELDRRLLIAHLFGSPSSPRRSRSTLATRYLAFWAVGSSRCCKGSAVLLSFWLILYWMYRRRLFLRL